MKKITAFIATLILAIGAMALTAFAADTDKTVTVRIEGKSSTYFYGKVTTTAANVAELMQEVSDNNESVTVYMTQGDYGSYITQINDDIAGSVAPVYYDGWSDLINGVAPSVGIDAQTISDGDEIVFYYADEYGSHGFLVPEVDASKIDEGIIVFTANSYDESYNPITVPVVGATVTWDNQTYTTDDNGQIVIADEYLTAGDHSLQISKVADDGMPLVLRLAADYKITVEEAQEETTETSTEAADENTDVDAGDSNMAVFLSLGLVAVAGIAVVGKKLAYEK